MPNDEQPRDDHGRFASTGGLSAWADKKAGDSPGKLIAQAQTAPIREATAAEFKGAFDAAFKDSDMKAFVSHYSEKELKGMKTFLSKDGKAGIAVHDHGDGRVEGTALFNNGAPKGTGAALLQHAVEKAGVNYLECYGEGLRGLYEKGGFNVTSSSPFNDEYASKDWNYEKHGRPNYYTLSKGGSHAQKD